MASIVGVHLILMDSLMSLLFGVGSVSEMSTPVTLQWVSLEIYAAKQWHAHGGGAYPGLRPPSVLPNFCCFYNPYLHYTNCEHTFGPLSGGLRSLGVLGWTFGRDTLPYQPYLKYSSQTNPPI